jgi:carbon storage regulator CsrA
MLVLTRREGERIIIEVGELKIIVTQLGRAHGGGQRVGIDAPDHVQINREEIYRAKQDERNQEKPCSPS